MQVEVIEDDGNEEDSEVTGEVVESAYASIGEEPIEEEPIEEESEEEPFAFELEEDDGDVSDGEGGDVIGVVALIGGVLALLWALGKDSDGDGVVPPGGGVV